MRSKYNREEVERRVCCAVTMHGCMRWIIEDHSGACVVEVSVVHMHGRRGGTCGVCGKRTVHVRGGGGGDSGVVLLGGGGGGG